MLSKLERAVVLDAGVRRLIRSGMRPGDALGAVARENDVTPSDVIGAVIDVRRMGLDQVIA